MSPFPEYVDVAPAESALVSASDDEKPDGGRPLDRQAGVHYAHGYHSGRTVPRLVFQNVATGGLVDMPSVPTWVRNVAAASSKGPGPAVLVLELGEAKFEAEVLLDMLTSLAREIRAGRFGEVVLVVATTQESVARIAQMVAETENLPMYVTSSSAHVAEARPAGRLTPTEKSSLTTLDQLGGRVTSSQFASATSLELTAAGNRLSNLARRGYVFRLARSRREGDEYVSLATFRDSPDAGQEGDASR